jgi:uncharacterized protein (DUF3820 family)
MDGNEMTDESIMPFGKHKGEKMANIPPDYLLWLYDNGKCYGEVRKYIADNLDVLKSEIDYKNKSK